ncbi:MAG: hypothetical protein EBT09_13505, partial [Actinobacteria bacterium]|nr:hypothetical protein [Actinomycetota bacterium]
EQVREEADIESMLGDMEGPVPQLIEGQVLIGHLGGGRLIAHLDSFIMTDRDPIRALSPPGSDLG